MDDAALIGASGGKLKKNCRGKKRLLAKEDIRYFIQKDMQSKSVFRKRRWKMMQRNMKAH